MVSVLLLGSCKQLSWRILLFLNSDFANETDGDHKSSDCCRFGSAQYSSSWEVHRWFCSSEVRHKQSAGQDCVVDTRDEGPLLQPGIFEAPPKCGSGGDWFLCHCWVLANAHKGTLEVRPVKVLFWAHLQLGISHIILICPELLQLSSNSTWLLVGSSCKFAYSTFHVR